MLILVELAPLTLWLARLAEETSSAVADAPRSVPAAEAAALRLLAVAPAAVGHFGAPLLLETELLETSDWLLADETLDDERLLVLVLESELADDKLLRLEGELVLDDESLLWLDRLLVDEDDRLDSDEVLSLLCELNELVELLESELRLLVLDDEEDSSLWLDSDEAELRELVEELLRLDRDDVLLDEWLL